MWFSTFQPLFRFCNFLKLWSGFATFWSLFRFCNFLTFDQNLWHFGNCSDVVTFWLQHNRKKQTYTQTAIIHYNKSILCSIEEKKSNIRQSKINSRSVAGPMGQMNHRPSVWCSMYYFFHNFLQNSLQKCFQCIFLFFFINLQK